MPQYLKEFRFLTMRVEIICYSFHTCLRKNNLSLFSQCLHSFFLYFESFLKHVILITHYTYYWVGQKICSGVSVPSDDTFSLSPLSPSSGSSAYLGEGITKPEPWWNFAWGDEKLKGLNRKSWVSRIIQRMWVEDLWLFQWSLWMWDLDRDACRVWKNWCFWTLVLENTVKSPLNCKEIQPVHRKGDQSWVLIGKTDAEPESPIF